MPEFSEKFSATKKPSWKETFLAVPFAIRFLKKVDPAAFYGIFAMAILMGPFSFFSIAGIKYLTDAVTNGRYGTALAWGGGLVALTLVSGGLQTFREWMTNNQRYRMEVTLREESMELMTRLPYAVLEDPEFQALSAAFSQKNYVLLNFQTNSSRIFQNVISLAGVLGGLVFIPWTASVLAFASLAATSYLFIRFEKWSWGVMVAETREGRRANYIQTLLTQPASLLPAKALELPIPFMRIWRRLSEKLLKERRSLSNRSLGVNLLGVLLETAGFASGLVILVPQVLVHAASVSSFVVFVSAYQRLTDLMESFSWQLGFTLQESGFLAIFKRLFTIPPELDRGKEIDKEPLRVRFEDVWFRYPDTKRDVIRGLSMEFSQGDQIALVGLNGAGKSTLLKLLMGVYEPTRGRITVNGQDLREIKPSSWRKALSVLTQNDALYDDVIRNQVHYGNYSRPLEEKRFERALAVSGLKQLAHDLPRGIETHAGKYYAMPEDEAIEPSGGQRQIIAIARTLYREARFYIFDEPTSSVDAEKEERFFQLLPSALNGSGVIFVSHRFSTLRRGAERIIVIDDGRIIEDGTHEELMAKGGRYAELFALQAKSYQLEPVT
ncbi:MAG TPA: ABC transporter ATP-binding protein [Patescibacteria group bacterium]|nr:ABC transporter ATP-binding protein [Patescibacteria group bacterium]